MNTIFYGIALAAMTWIWPIAPQDGVGVRVNGAAVRFQAAPPMLWHSRVLIPLKDVVDELGGSTKWNSRTTSLTVRVGSRTARIKIGTQLGDVEGRDIWLDVAPRTVNGTTMVPLTFFADAFGADVRWNERMGIARIDTGRGGVRTASAQNERGERGGPEAAKTESAELKQYRSLIMADGDSGKTIAEYDRYLTEQDFRRYQADRVKWVQDYRNYRDGLLSDGAKGDFEPSQDYAVYLRQRDFELYSTNQPGWRVGYNAFTRWRRTMNTTRTTPAFKQYQEDRAGLVASAETKDPAKPDETP
jgi:hypothetical protein